MKLFLYIKQLNVIIANHKVFQYSSVDLNVVSKYFAFRTDHQTINIIYNFFRIGPK